MDEQLYAIHEAEHGGLRLQVELQPRANYALVLSGIPFIRAIVVHNETGRDLPSLTVSGNLEIAGYPEPVPWSREMPGVHAAGSVSRLDRLADFQEFLPVLANAAESAPGRLDFRATSPMLPGVETRVIADLEVSAYNEYLNRPGLQSSLAAFVQPNTRTITGILRAASEHLLEETGDGALAGYQSGSERVHLIAASVYEAIRARQITYVNPPASFESTGQKVRTTEQVLTDRFGTCIDLSVLYAACLEAAGIFPVVFLIRGHAFAGYYTQDAHGETTLVTEPNTVSNLVELGILAPVELTGLNPGSGIEFRRARSIGAATIATKLDQFVALVDVRRAREEGIRPMPHFHTASDPVEDQRLVDEERPFVQRVTLDVADDEAAEAVRGVLEATDNAPPRLRNWKRDLLDLSLRNPLLNMPRTQKVMDLVVPEGMLARVDDIVHSGKQVRLTPADQVDAIQLARGVKTAADLSGDELRTIFDAQRQLYTTVAGDACRRQLRSMKREADTLEQETGSNYLYLTLGALVHPKKGGEARAPLFLLPIRLAGGLASRPYAIALDGQEIAQPNLCLLQWLKTTHGLDLPDLAEPAIDDAGIAIQTVFAGIRKTLVDARLPFRIDETCSVAILRFATFQIWKDLDEHWEGLIDNPVVRHLVERPGETFQDPSGDSDPAIDEASLRLPIAADGSQMAAVMRASAGQSFVLEGPPGTGKSQTITNLIAHALVEGKTVLFVAEKQAALEVVQRRLDAIGIGALALELHGSKQSMTSIRDQLRRALELTASVDQAAWDSADSAMRAAIARLAMHTGRVHDRNPAGHSLWSAYDTIAAAGRGPVATIPHRLVTPGGEATLDVAVAAERTRELQEMAIQIGLQPGHPWLVTGPGQGASLDAATLTAIARDLGAARQRLGSLSPIWRQHLRRFAPDGSLNALVSLLEAGVAGLVPPAATAPEIDRLSWRETVDSLRAATTAYQESHRNVLGRLKPGSLELNNLDNLIVQSASLDSVKLFRGMRQKGLIAEVNAHLVDGAHIDGDQATTFLTGWRSAREAASELRTRARAVSGLVLPGDWQPGDAEALAAIDRAAYISRLLVWLHGVDPRLAAEVSQASEQDLAILRDIDTSWQRWLEVLGASRVEVARWAPPTGRVARDWVSAWETDESRWTSDLAASGTLQPQRYRELARTAAQLGDMGLETFATEALSGSIPADQLSAALLRGLATVSIAERTTSGGLDQFDADAQDRAAASYVRQGQQLRDMQATRLAATIIAHRPFQANQLRGEVAELKRQLDRKRGGLSFRDLVKRYPGAILALTPCFLMSPGSVAHFLDPEAVTFDLVIFDEASQIRVPQSIGSMGRGKAVVVVGDSRQMPPTRIMEVSTGGTEEIPATEQVVVEDLESILSEAVESGLPQEWLTWHYRSQDESLIAFSNEHYYDDRLVSLPSPGTDPSTGLSWRRVDGVFDRGRSRTNEVEASAIVDEIVARLHDPATRDDSIGVVCFNIQQRDLILNKLEDSADPLVQQALTAAPGDALFVKNLENVQGDERDVILFSLAFSLDPATGKLPLNFGPLNGAGGERRLNVAVTRARKQVILFSSFDPKDIDLSRSGARGLRDLRRYVEYAAERPAATGDAGAAEPAAHSRLVSELAETLRGQGYEVGTGVGLSSFKVDLAVRKPGDHRWKVAVMVDGPVWASRPTVADRDGAPDLLTGIMHWPAVIRVWLPGWLRDRDGTIARIRAAVDRAPDVPRPQPALPPAPKPAVPAPPPAPRKASNLPAPGEPGVFTPADDSAIADRSVLDNIGLATPAIRRYAAEIMATEGPVRLDRLTLQIARRFGMRRIGAQKRDEIEAIIRKSARITEAGAEFAWPANLDPETWPEFRRNPASGDRDLDEISPQEIGNAMCWLLTSAISMSRDDLERETLTFFGYVRLTESARTWLAEAIALAVANGRITESDGRYRNT